ncbi:MAG TPA: cation-translocating P-type ATPase, partial [Acidobacteria bacterium]|nr:cation-translocating P-type ATPase [Acidobacteriota bacterium]
FLFAVSLLLESWSVGRARRAVQKLLELAPPLARVRDPRSGMEREVPPEDVRPGDVVVVNPGERIPLDGEVIEGRSLVDASPVTGESKPAAVEPGTEVYAGTIALDGSLHLRVSREASDTVLARIIRQVSEAGRRRAKSEQWVDRFALIYTPVVFAAAILTALIPPLAGLGTWADWTYRALVLLVIGCPCALVISTPVSIVAGLASAARNGVLVKGGDLLEIPARLAIVAIDKTGTLTTGRPRVERVIAGVGHTEEEVLAVAAALERRSGHPLGEAIVRAAAARDVDPAPADDVTALPGRGIEGQVEGRPAWLGSRRLLSERGQDTGASHEVLASLARGGRTVVAVGRDDHVCGFISLGDVPRPEAAATVRELHALGIENVAMLTGDNPETASEVAAAVGVDEVHAGLLPEDKVRRLEELRSRGALAFVGDGINDAPALALADLGIAMGGKGTDVAIETAHVALMTDDLAKIPWLIRHSRRTLAIIRANIAFALGVKAIFVVLTFAGHASLWAAIAADMGASLLVIANGLRLLGGSGAEPDGAPAPAAPALEPVG